MQRCNRKIKGVKFAKFDWCVEFSKISKLSDVFFIDPKATGEELPDQRKYPKLRRTWAWGLLSSLFCLRLTLAVLNSGVLKDSAWYPDSWTPSRRSHKNSTVDRANQLTIVQGVEETAKSLDQANYNLLKRSSVCSNKITKGVFIVWTRKTTRKKDKKNVENICPKYGRRGSGKSFLGEISI